jgi:hypothetical protein
MRDESPEAVARRAADAERKRQFRKKEKEEKSRVAAEKKASEATSFPEYWEQQRATLTVEERNQFEARENDVLDLEYCIQQFLDGTYDAVEEERVTLSELIDDVKLEAGKGLTEKIILIIPNLWGDGEKDLRERITRKGGPTVDLLNYGYRTGLDSFLHEQFRQKFMVTRTIIPSNYVTMRCTTCTGVESVPVSIAESYASLRRKFECATEGRKRPAALPAAPRLARIRFINRPPATFSSIRSEGFATNERDNFRVPHL